MGKITFEKVAPAERKVSYLNCGWVERGILVPPDPTLVRLERQVVTGTAKVDHRSIDLKQPRIIQLGKIRRPLGKYTHATLHQAIEMEYMGASEFEWGAPALSLRAIQAQFSLYETHKFEQVKVQKDGKVFSCRVFANFDTFEERNQYEQWLLRIQAGTLLLQEHSGFDKPEKYDWSSPEEKQAASRGDTMPFRTDFWWDLRNHIIFSFDKQFMGRLGNHLQNSFQFMDSAASAA